MLSRGAGIKVHALLLAAVAVCCSAVAGAEAGCGATRRSRLLTSAKGRCQLGRRDSAGICCFSWLAGWRWKRHTWRAGGCCPLWTRAWEFVPTAVGKKKKRSSSSSRNHYLIISSFKLKLSSFKLQPATISIQPSTVNLQTSTVQLHPSPSHIAFNMQLLRWGVVITCWKWGLRGAGRHFPQRILKHRTGRQTP